MWIAGGVGAHGGVGAMEESEHVEEFVEELVEES